MKKEAFALSLGLITAISLSGCGGSESTEALVPNMSPSPARIQHLQVSGSAQCLSVPKVLSRIQAAKASRAVVTDIQVLDDGRPVSEAFVRSVIHNTDLEKDSLKSDKPQDRYEQNDCQSIGMLDADGNVDRKIKLIQATPTRIVTEKMTNQNPGEPEEHEQLTYELTTTRKLTATVMVPYTTGHDKDSCGIGQEDHDVLFTYVIEFGERLGTAPSASARMSDMKMRAARYDNTAESAANHANEEAYCTKVKAAAPTH